MRTQLVMLPDDTFPSSGFFWGALVVLAICALLLVIDWMNKP
jgi:hypothetical protein